MNRSGEVLPRLLQKMQIPHQGLLVVVDTLDLAVGSIRLKRKGAHAGHNGLRSISSSLGTENYPRLYLGIGRPPRKSEVVEYVLSRPPVAERRSYEEMYRKAAQVIMSVAEAGVERAMNEVNRRRPD
jgi:PTH1 family peptidyl-tRNA hydrolase